MRIFPRISGLSEVSMTYHTHMMLANCTNMFLRTTVAMLTILPMVRSFVVTSVGSEELQAIDLPGVSVLFGHNISPARLASMTEISLNVVVPRFVTYGRQCDQ